MIIDQGAFVLGLGLIKGYVARVRAHGPDSPKLHGFESSFIFQLVDMDGSHKLMTLEHDYITIEVLFWSKITLFILFTSKTQFFDIGWLIIGISGECKHLQS